MIQFTKIHNSHKIYNAIYTIHIYFMLIFIKLDVNLD